MYHGMVKLEKGNKLKFEAYVSISLCAFMHVELLHMFE